MRCRAGICALLHFSCCVGGCDGRGGGGGVPPCADLIYRYLVEPNLAARSTPFRKEIPKAINLTISLC